MNLALIGLMIAQSVCSFDGLNLRRRPFQEPQQRGTNTLENKNGEETNVDSSLFIDVLRPPFGESQRSALGNDEIPYAIDMAPARSFTDPQRMTSKVTGSISSSQPVVVSCEFQNNWTAANQPTDYPIDNAHWSPIVIASHSDLYQMWSYAAVASSGVQEVAEVCIANMRSAEYVMLCLPSSHYLLVLFFYVDWWDQYSYTGIGYRNKDSS